jgi:bromodomain adjacent to zinc finger domain protein 1A
LFPGDLYSYIVADKQGHVFTAKGDTLSRKKGLFTKERLKLLLKQHCELADNVWKVKYPSLDKYKLQFAKFENFYAGPWPKFPRTAPTRRGPKNVLIHAAGGGGISKREAFQLEKNEKKKKPKVEKEQKENSPKTGKGRQTGSKNKIKDPTKESTPESDNETLYKLGQVRA